MTTTKETISRLIESNKVFICDFNDSFTFNIYSDFFNLGYSTLVRSYTDSYFWDQLCNKTDKFILVLGPGPGHPDDYSFSGFETFKSLENCFVLGICLGHQLLLKSMGAEIIESINKVHGQQVEIIDDKGVIFESGLKLKFQRYNSLTVDPNSLEDDSIIIDSKGELMVYRENNLLSCQFHPESVGTYCPNSIYDIAVEFLL